MNRMFMPEDEYEYIVYLRYDPEENIFYDECGFRIHNIYEYITPNDLLLFRNDPGYNIFAHRGMRNVLCEIIIEDGEELTDAELAWHFEGRACHFWTGQLCRFSGPDEASFKELCLTCSGR